MSTLVSYQIIESKLQSLHESTSDEEFGYDLLRIFSDMSETRINRVKDGKDNLLKEDNTFLVKKNTSIWMPSDLRHAHSNLDRVVESCNRPAPFHSDEERLELLFVLYEMMAKKN